VQAPAPASAPAAPAFGVPAPIKVRTSGPLASGYAAVLALKPGATKSGNGEWKEF
jgi:hypothetical protein